MRAIWKRELKSLFHNVIAWLFLGVTLFLFGLYFFVYNLTYGYPYVSYSLSAISFLFFITVPILTMRVLAEEKRAKTDQLLLTAPVSVGKIVLGKFLALATVYSISVAVICISPIVLLLFGDIPVAETYVAIFAFWLYGLACIAIGEFVSSVTESQVISAVLTFAVLFLGYMMSSITGVLSSEGNLLTKILGCYDLLTPMEDLMSGSLSLKAVTYYVTLIILFLFFAVQAIQKRRWSVSKAKISMSVFSIGTVAVVSAIAVVCNVLVSVMPETWTSFDVTDQKLFSLTGDTKEYLKTLDQDVTIYVLAAESQADDTLSKTLRGYEDGSDHITISYIDPTVQPNFAAQYTDDEVTQNSLFVVSENRSRVIDYDDIYTYELDSSSYTYQVSGYDAEGQVTSALQYVTRDDMPVIYELEGHEETSLSGDFSEVLEKANVTLSSLNLLQEDAVPEDAQALIINGPQTDLSEDDLNKILAYVENGGSLFLTLNYSSYSDMPNYQKLLEQYEISVLPGLVADLDRNYYYQNPFYLLPYVESTDVSGDLTGYSSVFAPYMMGMQVEDNDTYTYTTILSTSESAVAKANYLQASTYEAEEGDAEGSFAGGVSLVTASGGTVYVFGSQQMFTDAANQTVSGRNAELFSNVVSTLISEVDAEGTVVVAAKDYSVSYLTVSANAVLIYGIVWGLLIPIVLIITGIVIWARRRKR